MFSSQLMAASAHQKELLEARARIKAQRQLAAAQAQAAHRALTVTREKASNEAKSEFMSLMCHEVRTPLNGCLASAEMLLDTTLDVRFVVPIDGKGGGEVSWALLHRRGHSTACSRTGESNMRSPMREHVEMCPRLNASLFSCPHPCPLPQVLQRELAKTICVSGAILLLSTSPPPPFPRLTALPRRSSGSWPRPSVSVAPSCCQLFPTSSTSSSSRLAK